MAQLLLVHHESRRVGPADHFGGVESRFLHPAKMVRSASSAGCMVRRAAVARSGLTVHFLYVLSARGHAKADALRLYSARTGRGRYLEPAAVAISNRTRSSAEEKRPLRCSVRHTTAAPLGAARAGTLEES